MIEAIVGSTSAERVLLYLVAREEGYAADIAKTFDTNLSQMQKQLARMERDGLLISQKAGNTRIYAFNPRYAFVEELKALMEKVLTMCPENLHEELMMNRRRPRKTNKPL